MPDEGPKQPCTRASVSFPAEDYAELESIAKNRRVSLAWVVRDAVSRYLAQQRPLFTPPPEKEDTDAVQLQSH